MRQLFLMAFALALVAGCDGSGTDPSAELVRESHKAGATFASLQARDAILTAEVVHDMLAPVHRAIDAHARALEVLQATDPTSRSVAELQAAAATSMRVLQPVYDAVAPGWSRVADTEVVKGEVAVEAVDECDACLEGDETATCEADCGACPVELEAETTHVEAAYAKRICLGICYAAYLACSATQGADCGKNLRQCKRGCRCKSGTSS